MYLDSSRIKSLNRLHREMNDKKLPMDIRRRAGKAFAKIQYQAQDPHLAHLRERLSKATWVGDKREMWKLTNVVRDYTREEILEEFEEGLDR